MIKNAQLKKFNQKIADLPDDPQLTPDELKARFDACPEELREKHNELVTGLLDPAAASELGFAKTPGVPADNLQAAVENVQKQLAGIALGSVPEGSIGRNMLTGEVNAELDEIHSQIAQHAQVDADLQTQLNAKTEIVVGTYIGDNTETRVVNLGFTPKAVLVTNKNSDISYNGNTYGGFAVANGDSPGVKVTENGFMVYYNITYKLHTNRVEYSPYNFIAFK